jgi:hypothetical protein
MSDRSSWDDARLDRALREALALEPSPALQARVRARIASEPAPSSGLYAAWMPMAACAVVAMIVGVSIAGRWTLDPVMPPPLAGVRPAVGLATLPRAAAAVPAVIVSSAVARSADVRLDAWRDATADGAVQFAAGDRAAFNLLLRFSRSGRLPTLDLQPAASHDAEVPAIEFTAIDIPALVVSSVGEGGSQ